MLEIALALALAGGPGGLAGPSHQADAAPAQVPAARLSAMQMMRLAAHAEQVGKPLLAEQIYRTLQQDPNENVRVEATFRRAMLATTTGRIREAAVLLRRVIDSRPDAQRARLELASVLVRLGDEQGARRELRAVRAGQLPPELARMVDRWSETLRSRKPFGVTVEVAMAPDSNINRATRSDTLDTIIGDLDITRDGKERSGVGIAMNALVWT